LSAGRCPQLRFDLRYILVHRVNAIVLEPKAALDRHVDVVNANPLRPSANLVRLLRHVRADRQRSHAILGLAPHPLAS
jgi:hypothetical protein